MRYYKPEQILKAIPEARTISIPDDWFEHLNENESIFNLLYKWMVKKCQIPAKDFNALHNLTFISQRIHNRLLTTEKKRIAKQHHLKGVALQRHLNWIDGDQGPQTLFANKPISGESLIVVPSTAEDKINAIQNIFLEKDREKQNLKIQKLASGQNFSQWLFSNSERDDLIGDLAKDALRDKNFPKNVKFHEDIKRYLEFHGPAALEALDDAWLEYSMRYPDRIVRSAWCDGCGKQIKDFSKSRIAWGEENGFQILHDKCLSCDLEESEILNNLFLKFPNFSNLDSFAKMCGAIPERIEGIKRRLTIWGWIKVSKACIPQVYFIQSGSSGPIKIGYTSSSVKRRLATLQTAHHEKLVILASMDGSRSLEKELHSKFRPHHIINEWFSPDKTILEYMKGAKNNKDRY